MPMNSCFNDHEFVSSLFYWITRWELIERPLFSSVHSLVLCHFLRNTTPLDQIANMGGFLVMSHGMQLPQIERRGSDCQNWSHSQVSISQSWKWKKCTFRGITLLKRFCKLFCESSIGQNYSCQGNFPKTIYETFFTTCRPRLCHISYTDRLFWSL